MMMPGKDQLSRLESRELKTRLSSLTFSPVSLSVSPFLRLRDCVIAGLGIAPDL